MNTAQHKLVVWSVTGLLGTGMVMYLALSLTKREEWNKQVPVDRMQSVLSDVPEVSEQRVSLLAASAVERGLKQLDWSGRPPPDKPVEPIEAPKGSDSPRELVRDLIQIRAIRYDGANPAASEVVFKYKSTAMVVVPTYSDGTYLKRGGDRLDGRLNQIEISAIYPGNVEFRFTNEAGRENELVAPTPFSLTKHYAYVGEGQAPVSRPSAVGTFVSRRPDSPPEAQTVRISPTKYRVGLEDAQEINDNFAEIMTTEVSIDRHRDPKTKRFDGIEIKQVKPGSIAARHGVEEGDVIKSINGQPVSSKEEAIVYVKNNKDKYDAWEVEIWNKGQTRTVTYYSPKKK
ncbi:MAG: PDZ domain-containing protein [Planctomycetes bacterium]|nr:PDZ domain-containing protein [Planctomycetota bacterium]